MHAERTGVRRRPVAAILSVTLGIVATWPLLLLPFALGPLNAQEAAFYSGPVAPLSAAVWEERIDEVRRLLREGVNPDWPDGTPELTPWQVAVIAGDQPSLDLFASHDRTRPSSHYTSTLFKVALQRGDARLVAAFVRGHTPLTFGEREYSPLAIAAANGYDDVMQVLMGAGVDINAQNGFGDTALMAAVRSGRLEAVNLLLDRGANIRLADRDGRTAMSWAVRMGRRSVIQALRAGGAADSFETGQMHPRPQVPLRTAVSRALVLLQEGGESWLERAACASCHHQGLLLPVVSVARRQGFVVNDEQAHAQDVRLRSMLKSMEPGFRAASSGEGAATQFGLGFIGQATSGSAWLLSALASTPTRAPLDEVMAVTLGRAQMANGRWRVGAPRLPVQESDIQTTALVIRVLLTFASSHPDTVWRVERARAWLLTSVAGTAPERAYRLLGLRWAGADPEDVKEAVKALVRDQGEDGGWAQLPGLNADAYATGLALVALREGGEMPPANRAYQRGLAYLIRTQEADGSWFVAKRAASFNEYIESGAPHGMHQFSSFAGTAWATMALMYGAGAGTP